MCVVAAVEAILKTGKSVDKLNATSFEEVPTVKKALSRIAHNGSSSTYQGADLTKFSEAVSLLKANHQHSADLVQGCLRDRWEMQDSAEAVSLSQVLTILATQGWEKTTEASFAHTAIED